MLGRWKIRVAAMAAIAVGGIASVAHADTVTFSTFGTFTPTSGSLNGDTVTESDGSIGNPGSITLTNGMGQSAEIEFTGVTSDSVNAPVATIPFGTFDVSSSNPTILTSFNGSTFTLHVNETVPGSGNGSTLGTVIGTVITQNLGQTTDLTITFASPTVSIPGGPGVTYTIDNGAVSPLPTNVVTMIVTNGSNPQPSTLGGDVTVAPLPATASTGLALLGGLGVLGGVSVLRRRRQMA